MDILKGQSQIALILWTLEKLNYGIPQFLAFSNQIITKLILNCLSKPTLIKLNKVQFFILDFANNVYWLDSN